MTFVVAGSENSVMKISSQLNKLIDVVEASDISEQNTVWRE
jgi:acetolactate synthase small subunit